MEDVSRSGVFTFSQFSFVFIFSQQTEILINMYEMLYIPWIQSGWFYRLYFLLLDTDLILKASWVQIYSNQGETEYISASNTKKYWSWWWNPPFLVTQFILSWLPPFHHYHFMLYLSPRDSWGFSNVSSNIFDNALLIVFRMAKWNRSGNGLLEDFKQLL